ncbi:Metallo-dependent hydrolase [Neolentinus lepideus HHB14362 ss-1]|uniref:Metallo-dependent hydrolase n=1 Tax=Neolentinus lepideus HHB14362 ss-1 TaxID=1314782 RepID=A0A165R938_9AGAM|nr:Metallo-dependent hydrolase [Neolentinus lepideus HHB14362 ss-1]
MSLASTFVHCPSVRDVAFLEDHLLAVNQEGFITHIGPFHSEESAQILRSKGDAEELIIIPRTGLHLPLMQWLDEYAYKAEEKLDADLGLAKEVYSKLAQRLIDCGTGAVLLFGTIKEETNLVLAEVMQAAGIRAFVGKLSMDISSRPTYREASTQSALTSARSFVHRCRSLTSHLPAYEQLVQPVVTPRFVPTCTNELLAGLGQLAQEENVMIQSHIAEAYDQVEWVKRERGVEDTKIFATSNLLTPRTVLAHCTFIGPLKLQLLASTGMSVAHCPLSNAYFSEKPFELASAIMSHMKVGLGSDIAGGYTVDIMHAMRQAVVTSKMKAGFAKTRWIDAHELAERGTPWPDDVDKSEPTTRTVDWTQTLYLSTRGGAEALGLQGGVFTVGAPFDAQQIKVFDPANGYGVGAIDFFGEVEDGDKKIDLGVLEKWWCIGDTRNRTAVWVQGKQL